MSALRDEHCLFCKIVESEIPSDVVHETATTLAFRDIEPQAPTHVLVIPRNHYPDAASVAEEEPGTAVDLIKAAQAVAEKERLSDGYRLVFNTGSGANQVVFHAHLHLLGGRPFSWPPG